MRNLADQSALGGLKRSGWYADLTGRDANIYRHPGPPTGPDN